MKYVFVPVDTCKPDKGYPDITTFAREKGLSRRYINKCMLKKKQYAYSGGILYPVEFVKNELHKKRKGRDI